MGEAWRIVWPECIRDAKGNPLVCAEFSPGDRRVSEQQQGNVVDLGDDDGYVTFRIGGVEVKLDVWEVNNKVFAFHQQNSSKDENEYADGLVSLMESLGFPRGSHRLAHRFVQAIQQQVESIKKKGDGSAASPASTTSTPAV